MQVRRKDARQLAQLLQGLEQDEPGMALVEIHS